MNGDMFLGFLGGAFVATVIWGVFAAGKFWDLYQAYLNEQKAHQKTMDALIHCEDGKTEIFWTETGLELIPKAKEAALYEKYSDLVQPGTEVLDLTGAEDEVGS